LRYTNSIIIIIIIIIVIIIYRRNIALKDHLILTVSNNSDAALCYQGILLHPYLSLHLFHLLSDVSIRGFVIGATNALFRQKTHLLDVVVEVGF